jgi:hypothetical protein
MSHKTPDGKRCGLIDNHTSPCASEWEVFIAVLSSVLFTGLIIYTIGKILWS